MALISSSIKLSKKVLKRGKLDVNHYNLNLTLKLFKVHLKGGVAHQKQEGGGVLNKSVLTSSFNDTLGGTV